MKTRILGQGMPSRDTLKRMQIYALKWLKRSLSLQNRSLEKAEMLKDWRDMAGRIAEAARRILGDVEVVVFGSIVKGGFTAASDIDMLIVLKDMPMGAIKRAELKKAVEEEAGLPPIHPVEIHLVTKKEVEANPIYRTAVHEGVTL